MGNQLLKRGAAILLIGAMSLSAEITINDIDKLVNDIKQERVGLTDKEIMKAKDPFIYLNGKYARVLRSTSKKRRYRFSLTAIINDRVKINRKWYRIHDKVRGFKIAKVEKNFVILMKNGEQIRVFLKRPRTKKIKLIMK